jgi:hypothetical protein
MATDTPRTGDDPFVTEDLLSEALTPRKDGPRTLSTEEWARLRAVDDIARELVDGWDNGFPVENEYSATELIDRLRPFLTDPVEPAEAAAGPRDDGLPPGPVLADVATVLVDIEDGREPSEAAFGRLSEGWQRLLHHIAAPTTQAPREETPEA